jgi:hypothetical protein
MSDLFGNTATPRWQDPTEREALLQKMGQETAEPFNRAYQAGLARRENEAAEVRREGRAEDLYQKRLKDYDSRRASFLQDIEEYKGSTPRWQSSGMSSDTGEPLGPDEMSDVQTGHVMEPKDAFDFIAKNPKWALDPIIGKEVGQWLGGMGMSLKIQEQAEALKIRADNGGLSRDRDKRNTTWEAALGNAPAGVQSAIDALPNQGWNLDGQGRRISPSQEAISIFDMAATEGGKHPENRFTFSNDPRLTAQAREGAKKTPLQREQAHLNELKQQVQDPDLTDEERERVQSDIKSSEAVIKKLGVSGLDVAAKRDEYWKQHEDVRQEHRKEIQSISDKNKVAIEKMREEAQRERSAGKGATNRSDFIDKRFMQMKNSILKNWDEDKQGPKSEAKASSMAIDILGGLYGEIHPDTRGAADRRDYMPDPKLYKKSQTHAVGSKDEELEAARKAIDDGKDEEAVKQLYKERTGEDFPE